MKRKIAVLTGIIFQVMCWQTAYGQKAHYPSIKSIADQPMIYVGKRQPGKRFYDGQLPHAVGVHSFQVFRANRSHPANPGPNGQGLTYNHQPYLAYWNGKFYLQYLSCKVGENVPPGRTNIQTSKNGRHWSRPRVVFPEYVLSKLQTKLYHSSIVEGKVVMHQRMGFYVAPNGVLLTSGFYGPVGGEGIGRVVRRIYKDDSLGPIYFILYNGYNGFGPDNTNYPYYKSSHNKAFKAACDSLLADPLMRQQWWEDQRDLKDFFPVTPQNDGGVKPKAFAFFHRADGVVVGMWKGSAEALSGDNGKTWTPLVKDTTRWTVNAKTWGQRLSNGRYALVYDHSATHLRGGGWQGNRFPLVVMTSDDAHTFNNMLVVAGQVPPTRYSGRTKDRGPQYVRGIIEGNGNPPGKDMWVAYSMNKEDIWVSRIHVPIKDHVSKPVSQTFDKVNRLSDLPLWNFYVPKWAPISIKEQSGHPSNHFLELKDMAPYDYALAERVFPTSKKVTIYFKVNPKRIIEGHGLYVNVDNRQGERVLRLFFFDSGKRKLRFDLKDVEVSPMRFHLDHWYNVTLTINCKQQKYSIKIDGKEIHHDIPFAFKVDSVSKLVFRTGPYRNYVPSPHVNGKPAKIAIGPEDKPGAGEKAPPCIYWIDDVKIHR
jgi:hypothetical protein